MKDLKVEVDLSGLLELSGAARAGILQNLSAAVERVAMVGAERWKSEVGRVGLWSGEAKAYADSIEYRMTGPYSATISATYKYVEDIEDGRPPFDMKAMLNTSMKVRNGKRGRYLIIPIRHGTPGSNQNPMPAPIYAAAKALPASRITGRGTRVSGTGAYDIKTKQQYLVAKNRYKWGGRLPPGMAPKLKPQHHSDPYAGLVRFDSTAGGKMPHSSYLTFRIMGEWQTGAWILPAKEGLHIARGIAQGLQTDASSVFGRALQTDIAAL
jgi:hypothetical protein